MQANSARGSYPFGETDCEFTNMCVWEEVSQLGENASGQRVFDVRAKYRGDVARAHFYMAIRYDFDIAEEVEDILREWNRQDPVSDVESRRNDRIESVQFNRNPFVDRPDFIQHVSDY